MLEISLLATEKKLKWKRRNLLKSRSLKLSWNGPPDVPLKLLLTCTSFQKKMRFHCLRSSRRKKINRARSEKTCSIEKKQKPFFLENCPP